MDDLQLSEEENTFKASGPVEKPVPTERASANLLGRLFQFFQSRLEPLDFEFKLSFFCMRHQAGQNTSDSCSYQNKIVLICRLVTLITVPEKQLTVDLTRSSHYSTFFRPFSSNLTVAQTKKIIISF